jgi:NDP-sugar pyrophosphorylase family protein
LTKIHYEGTVTAIQKSWHIFQVNAAEIRKDYELITSGRRSEPLEDPHTIVYNASQVFIEPGAKIKAAVLNAEGGPIYIGKNAEVQEGSLIRGPFALCEGSTVNMGAKMRGIPLLGHFQKLVEKSPMR